MRGLALPLALASLLALCAHAAHVVELQQRERSAEENVRLLDFLQLGEEEEEEDGDEHRPNVRLNSDFFGKIDIGDSKQNFDVVFDTGSSVLWVYSDKCQSCKGHQKHVFSPQKSHTFHKREQPFSIRYGTGESRGTTGVDKIFIADLEVKDQAFGQCEQPDSVMRNFPFDGIVGLSRALVNDPNAMPTIIKNIKEEKILESKELVNTFSFYIGREEGEPTYLVFGGSHDMLEETTASKRKDLEESSKHPNIHYVATLNKNIYWEVPFEDIFVHETKHRASVASTVPGHMFEQRPHITASADSFAARELDPELALLEVESDLALLEGNTAGKKQHGKVSIHSDIPNSRQHGKAKKASKQSKAAHQLEEEQRQGAAPQPTHKRKVRSMKSRPTAELEDKAKITTHKPTHHVKGDAATGDDEVGYGELVSNFKAPGVSMNPCQQDDEHSCIASVDSGHSLISGPPDIIRSLKKKVSPPSGTRTCSDEVMSTLPDVSFVIGGKMFTMEPVDYLIELEDRCVPAFSERAVRNGHDWVLGEHFMRTYYTVFDYDNMRVGFSHLDLVKPHIDKIIGSASNAIEGATKKDEGED